MHTHSTHVYITSALICTIPRKGDTKTTCDQHAVLSSGGIVYGIRADGLFCRTWTVFDVAGKAAGTNQRGTEGVGVHIQRDIQLI